VAPALLRQPDLSVQRSTSRSHDIIIKYKLVMMMSTDMTDTKPLNGSMGHEGTPDVNDLTPSEVKYYVNRVRTSFKLVGEAVEPQRLTTTMAAAVFQKIAADLYWLRRDGNMQTPPSSVSGTAPELEEELDQILKKRREEEETGAEPAPGSEAAAEPAVGSEAAAEPAPGSEAAWTGDPRRLVEKLGVKEARKFLLNHGWMSSQNPHVVWTYATPSYDRKLFINLRNQTEWTLE